MSFFGKLFGKKKKEVKEVTVKPAVEPVKIETPKPVMVEETKEVVKAEETPVVKEEPTPETVEAVEEEPKPEVVVETKQKVSVKSTSVEDAYEVRTHKEDGWQVIKKGASRARRRFDTQAECINYCKDMNYEFVIFKKDGEKR